MVSFAPSADCSIPSNLHSVGIIENWPALTVSFLLAAPRSASKGISMIKN
jgi:hypothetical protein